MHGHTMEYNGNQRSRGLVSFYRQGKKKKEEERKKETFNNSVMLKLGDNTDKRKYTQY